jgi:stress response protein YsnF
MLRERTVEMRETSEEPVIGKEARVKEEVVVQKTANERTENVQDTVRETKVEVDEDDRSPNR